MKCNKVHDGAQEGQSCWWWWWWEKMKWILMMILSIWEDETQEDHTKFEVLHHIIILTNQEMMITEERTQKKRKLTCSSFHLEGLVGSCQIGTLAAPPWASSVLFFRTHKKTQFLGHFLCTTSTNTNHFRWGGSAKQTQNCKVTKIDFGLLCFKICVFHRPELGASSSASPQKDPEL